MVNLPPARKAKGISSTQGIVVRKGLAMSDFDSNPFADPDFSNPFQVASQASFLANVYAANPSEARLSGLLTMAAS